LVDKVIEKHKFRLLREILFPRILSPTNLLWHLILKETEIRNVRLILKALSDGMPTSEIKDYLVIGP
jgi:vacuolar-type H+-ATPase subunit C/Vma6